MIGFPVPTQFVWAEVFHDTTALVWGGLFTEISPMIKEESRVQFPKSTSRIESSHFVFLLMLARVEKTARFYFRQISCDAHRQDCVCETIALCWLWHCRLVRKGRDPARFASAMARLAAKSVASGRRLCGQERATEASSRHCQWRRRFVAVSLSAENRLDGSVFDDTLADDTQTPVPDQVQFRCDFAKWRSRLSRLRLRILVALAQGHRTTDVAARFGISPGRVSQIRVELRDDWNRYCECE